MKIGFVSDTQGNAPALLAVLKHMESQEVDKKVHLGNIVGWCPYPDSVVELTVANFNYILRGRMDEATVDPEQVVSLNPLEKEAIEWTQNNALISSKAIIENLDTAISTTEGLLFAHGSPHSYRKTVQTSEDAEISFGSPLAPFEVAFVGQTGVPAMWVKNKSGELAYIRPKYKNMSVFSQYEFVIPDDSKAILNVGSVGLPKDSDPRSSYVVYDTESKVATYFRVPYSIDKTVGKMQQHGFQTNACLRILHGK